MKYSQAIFILALGLGMTACELQKAQKATSNDVAFSFGEQGILGGTTVNTDDPVSKSTVAISSSFQGGVFCSGTLIAKNLVLTAAHCASAVVDPHQMAIVFATDLAGPRDVRVVSGGNVPDEWLKFQPGQESNFGDLVVLKFDGEAPEGFEPAPLLEDAAQLVSGMSLTMAGYGYLAIQPQVVYANRLLKTDVQLGNPHFASTEIEFSPSNSKACHGDSGGPVYATINGLVVLAAVISRSETLEGTATCDTGVISTSIPAEIQFIHAAEQYLNSDQFVAGELIAVPKPATSSVAGTP